VPLLLGGIVGMAVGTAAAENIDPAGDDHQYAWGENIGWVNASRREKEDPAWPWRLRATAGCGARTSLISPLREHTSCGTPIWRGQQQVRWALLGWGRTSAVNFGPTGCEPIPPAGLIDPATVLQRQSVGRTSAGSASRPEAPSPDGENEVPDDGGSSGAPVLSVGKSGQAASFPGLPCSPRIRVGGKLSTLRTSRAIPASTDPPGSDSRDVVADPGLPERRGRVLVSLARRELQGPRNVRLGLAAPGREP
jgi:hypothetical protein